MAISMENYATLTKAVNLAKPVSTFVKDTFFKQQKTSFEDVIYFERTEATDGLASLNILDGPAKLVGKSTKTITTAKLISTYEKMTFTIKEYNDMKKLGGMLIDNETDGGKTTEFNKWVLQETLKLRDRVVRRQEQLCVEAMATGAISVTEGGVTHAVNYNFPSANKPGLIAAADRWSATTSNPIEQIRKFSKVISKKTGSKVDTVIMGSDAADAFMKHATILDGLDKNNFKMGSLEATATANAMVGATFIMTLPGGINLYEYAQEYTNAAGSTANMLDSKGVILASTQGVGAGAFEYVNGVIHRFGNNSANIVSSRALYANTRTSDDGKFVIFELESKGLPLIKVPEFIYTYSVIA
jgi:hypothetical protein